MKTDRVDVTWGQARLAWVWFVGAGLAFVLVILETLPGAPLNPAKDAWDWFLPLVIPTLSLMLGTIVFHAQGRPEPATVGRPAYVAALALSLFYLVAVIALLALWPWLRLWSKEEMPFLDSSRPWLTAVQGLVGIALGAFFVSGGKPGD